MELCYIAPDNVNPHFQNRPKLPAMKKRLSLLLATFVLLLLFACNNTPAAKDEPVAKPVAAAVSNPNFGIAPIEYAGLSEKALNHVAKFEFDAWGEMLADNVVFAFPDGDQNTRTKLEGKAAVLAWWKNWHATSGVSSMTMTEFNHFPLEVTAQPKGGASMGIYDFAYFTNNAVYNNKSVSLRMNFITHFNADKKIDRYITYYDRTLLIKAIGKNLLEKK